ncbi:MAG: uracil-DNA glycosylase [Phycisphaerales bacterium]|nr:uracil-DNA glycosylase [Phycisphaerales bacterium]
MTTPTLSEAKSASGGPTRPTRRGSPRSSLARIEQTIPRCTRCADLRDYCAKVARTKRKAYLDCDYWGKPVPGFGDHHAAIWVLGLAPGAHGANRTGRMFTGDRSGDFLYAALHRAGLASQAESVSREDGLTLTGVYISAACRCAPPANKPNADQLATCAAYLDQEYAALRDVRVIFCLGGIAWRAALGTLGRAGCTIPRPRPRFAHGAKLTLADRHILACYHVSQQNTFTGRLTPAMLDTLLARAKLLGRPPA